MSQSVSHHASGEVPHHSQTLQRFCCHLVHQRGDQTVRVVTLKA